MRNLISPTGDSSTCWLLDKVPREVRDMIYGYLGGDSYVQGSQASHECVRIKDGPVQSMLLVNKRISREYIEECERMATLVFLNSHDNSCYMPLTWEAPIMLRKIKKAHAILIANCVACDETTGHDDDCILSVAIKEVTSWLARMTAQLPLVTSLSVKLHIPWPYWDGDEERNFTEWPQSPHPDSVVEDLKDITNILHIARINVVGHTTGCLNISSTRPDQVPKHDTHQYVRWTTVNGWDDLQGDFPVKGEKSIDQVELEGFEYLIDQD